jgi:hypothetical protein
MWQSMYTVFTAYEGVYIFYLVPIVYFIVIVLNVISSRHKEHQRIGIKDLSVVGAILLILLDFVYYLYLFFSKTGELLQPQNLLIKYAVGGVLWLWIFWYSYEKYFARHIAGEQFKARYANLLWISGGSLVLAIFGVMMS